MATYVAQTVTSFTASDPRGNGATFVLIFFAVGIARSWELLGLRGGGLLDFLVSRGESAVPAAAAESAVPADSAEPVGGQPPQPSS